LISPAKYAKALSLISYWDKDNNYVLASEIHAIPLSKFVAGERWEKKKKSNTTGNFQDQSQFFELQVGSLFH